MDKNRKTMIGVGVGVLVLLACCVCLLLGIGVYVYQEQLMAWLGLAPSQKVARILPGETQFYASLNPNVQNVAGYQNLKKLYIDNPDVQAVLDEFESEVKKETNLIYEEDIKPWLGPEVVLALPDLTQALEGSSDTPPIVLAAQTTDQAASDNFIKKVLAEAAKDSEPFTEEVYQDVTLHIQENQFSNDKLVVTTFDNLVVIASGEQLVRDMIDKSKGKSEQTSLAENAQFKKITGELPANAVATIYMDLSGLFDVALQESAFELPPESTQDLEAFEAVAMAGTLQPDGVQIDVVATYDVEQMSEQMKTSLRQSASANAVLDDVPAEALFVYNGNNLNNIWQQTKKSLESNPDFNEGMKDLEEELGFSFENDVFGWMTGEFAVVLLEVPPPDEYSPPLGGYALIGADDVDNARNRVDKVIAALEEQGEMPPLETETIDGIEMKVFRNSDDQIQGGYGFYKNYFLLAYLEDSIKAVTVASQSPLTGSDNFKTVQNRLPGQNNGYMYADFDRVRSVVEDQLSDYEREDYQKNVRPFLVPIHAIGAASSTGGAEQGVNKGSFFILISE
ncbi:MAG: DUF3352 domain-containing protein [Anaerolineae bacterium]|nr:DUF3352 domain-containing protein [Anaerolineae bacterium]